MGRERSTSDLLFLLSLGVLGAGCPGEEGDEGATADDAASTTAGTSGGTTAGTGTAGTGTAGTGTSGLTGSGSVATVELSDSSSGTGGGVECGEFPGIVGEIGEGCSGYVAIKDMCLGLPPLTPECIAYSEAACQYQIEYSVMAYGEACGTAYEELFVCLSQLTCDEFNAPEPCSDEVAALETSCM